jgi:hypothetical protein
VNKEIIMKRSRTAIAAFLMLTLFSVLSAEEVLTVPQTDTAPVIDGKLDDPAWAQALKLDNFKTINPDYGKEPSQRSIAYMTYDSENIYFAMRCFDEEPGRIKASVSSRDGMFQDDYVAIMLDTFNTMQEGFGFFLNPLGIQGDGMINADGNADASFDMVWFSKGQIDDEGFSVECQIPLKSIRFPGKKTKIIRVAFFRQVTRNSEMTGTPPMFADKGSILKQSQAVSVTDWHYKRVVELLPALTHSNKKMADGGELITDDKSTDFSLTGKVGITSDLTLDAAYNPDFSQIEADAGQIDVNLRYQLYYPEKRPFFLEGNDLFQFAGNVEDGPLATVVHTRRIVDPSFGFKLTGKLGRTNTLAAIYAQDDLPDDPLDQHPDFTVVRFKHALKEDSYIGGFYTGKESGQDFNRVVGSDARIRLSDTSMVSYHIFGSFTQSDGNGGDNNGHALGLNYNFGNRKFILDLGYQDISKDFQIDTGFITRTGLRRISAFTMYRFYPKSKFFNRIEPFYWSYHLYDTNDNLFETLNLFTLRFQLPRNTMIRFDGILANEVFTGERFRTSRYGFQGESQITKQVYAHLFFRHGGSIYYDPDAPYQGYGNSMGGAIQYQPLEKFTFVLSFSYVDFFRDEDRVKLYDYSILRSRNTFQINKYLFLRAIVEYNTFRDRLTADLLASFTYIPGTVIHVGYGSAIEKLEWDGESYIGSDKFMETNRGFFFKISYLWRF